MDPNLAKNWTQWIYIDFDPFRLDLVILHELKPIIELDPIGFLRVFFKQDLSHIYLLGARILGPSPKLSSIYMRASPMATSKLPLHKYFGCNIFFQ